MLKESPRLTYTCLYDGLLNLFGFILSLYPII